MSPSFAQEAGWPDQEGYESAESWDGSSRGPGGALTQPDESTRIQRSGSRTFKTDLLGELADRSGYKNASPETTMRATSSAWLPAIALVGAALVLSAAAPPQGEHLGDAERAELDFMRRHGECRSALETLDEALKD